MTDNPSLVGKSRWEVEKEDIPYRSWSSLSEIYLTVIQYSVSANI